MIAKQVGYTPWPAYIDKLNGRTAIVYYFGTKNRGSVKVDEIVPVNVNIIDSIAQLLRFIVVNKTIRSYGSAVRELEIKCNVPFEFSITYT